MWQRTTCKAALCNMCHQFAEQQKILKNPLLFFFSIPFRSSWLGATQIGQALKKYCKNITENIQ